jgi:hypothetical protein
VAYPELATGDRVDGGAIRRAVVGDQAFHSDRVCAVVLDRAA